MAVVTSVLFALFNLGHALYVVPSSSCATICSSGRLTGSGDLSCSDDGYFTTDTGIKFQDCMRCELASAAVNGTSMSDQYWAIFHMRYTQGYCIFQEVPPIAPIAPCADACLPLKTVLTINPIEKQPYQDQYKYCSDDSDSYTRNGPRCAQCLQAQAGAVVVGNFMSEMIALCSSQPPRNAAINTARDLYLTSTIPITATITPPASSAPANSVATGTPSTSPRTTPRAGQNAPAEATTDRKDGGLSTGAAAGIGVACAVVAIAVIAGTIWLILRRRRKTAYQRANTQHATEAPTIHPMSRSEKYLYKPRQDDNRSELRAGPAPLELSAGRNRTDMDMQDTPWQSDTRYPGHRQELPG